MRRTPLLSAKVTPPRPHRRLLRRPGLDARVREALDYRVTIVQAGTGYGKTTALTALAEAGAPVCWYTISPGDGDPQVFLAYLIAAFAAGLPGLSDAPAAALEEGAPEGAGWTYALDALLGALDGAVVAPALLVLDDYHFVAASPEVKALTERLITYAPPDLHVVLATRYPLPGSELVRWRARGEVLELSREALAFSEAEIGALFREVYGVALDEGDLLALAFHTEGWPIALQLVWQGLRGSPARGVADLLAGRADSLGALFDYLASDVLGHQPPTVASFLRETAVLRELTPAVCDAVRQAGDSAALLRQLRDRDLFVIELGEQHYRYHHVFHEFLRQHTTQGAATAEGHRRAAAFFEARGEVEEAVHHWLAAGAYAEAATAIEAGGEATLVAGRLDTLAGWIDALPPGTFAGRPRLHTLLGDLYRLRSRFDEALLWYAQAEAAARARADHPGLGRALRGQALVYLDQVRPAQAESLLEEALALSDGADDRAAHARLLELLAENKLNMGKPAEAEALRAEARALREEAPAEDLLSVRVKLRTGRLDEARATLEGWAAEERRAAERGQPYAPRGHRETVLILSLIHSCRGEVARAAALADEGLAIGERLGSPFITAVAHTRRGHALQVQADAAWGLPGARDEAIRCYQRSIALGDRLAVRRIRAEAMWGLTRAHGFGGDLEAAAQAAREGIEVAQWAGDQWIAALVELSLGASLVLAGRAGQSLEPLGRVLLSFRSCGDSFGRAATRLWLAIAHAELRQPAHAAACLDDALGLCAAHGYEFLFAGPTLIGPPDPRRAVPLLVEARARPARAEYAGRLLAGLGLAEVQHHPGFQLRVQTLGAFRVWRGAQEVEAREWQRDKARQLFQLLVARRGRWMQRDELCELLWPQLAPEAAGRDFKVALSALNKAIEPGRPPEAPTTFVARDGAAYRLRPEADLWLDSEAFADGVAQGLALLDADAAAEGAALLARALGLYSGPYLPDALYEDWAGAERERLAALYLRGGERLAAALIAQGRDDEAAELCMRLIAHDRCDERAYRLLMLAQARQGNRALALRTYQRCAEALHDELGVDPSPETVALLARIRRPEVAL